MLILQTDKRLRQRTPESVIFPFCQGSNEAISALSTCCREQRALTSTENKISYSESFRALAASPGWVSFVDYKVGGVSVVREANRVRSPGSPLEDGTVVEN